MLSGGGETVVIEFLILCAFMNMRKWNNICMEFFAFGAFTLRPTRVWSSLLFICVCFLFSNDAMVQFIFLQCQTPTVEEEMNRMHKSSESNLAINWAREFVIVNTLTHFRRREITLQVHDHHLICYNHNQSRHTGTVRKTMFLNSEADLNSSRSGNILFINLEHSRQSYHNIIINSSRIKTVS